LARSGNLPAAADSETPTAGQKSRMRTAVCSLSVLEQIAVIENLAMAYVDPEYAVEHTELEVFILGKKYG